jgi:hypothetical protein
MATTMATMATITPQVNLTYAYNKMKGLGFYQGLKGLSKATRKFLARKQWFYRNRYFQTAVSYLCSVGLGHCIDPRAPNFEAHLNGLLENICVCIDLSNTSELVSFIPNGDYFLSRSWFRDMALIQQVARVVNAGYGERINPLAPDILEWMDFLEIWIENCDNLDWWEELVADIPFGTGLFWNDWFDDDIDTLTRIWVVVNDGRGDQIDVSKSGLGLDVDGQRVFADHMVRVYLGIQ